MNRFKTDVEQLPFANTNKTHFFFQNSYTITQSITQNCMGVVSDMDTHKKYMKTIQ